MSVADSGSPPPQSDDYIYESKRGTLDTAISYG